MTHQVVEVWADPAVEGIFDELGAIHSTWRLEKLRQDAALVVRFSR